MTPSMMASMARQMAARWSAKNSALWSKVDVDVAPAGLPLLTRSSVLTARVSFASSTSYAASMGWALSRLDHVKPDQGGYRGA